MDRDWRKVNLVCDARTTRRRGRPDHLAARLPADPGRPAGPLREGRTAQVPDRRGAVPAVSATTGTTSGSGAATPRAASCEDFEVEVNEGEVVLDIIHRLQATQATDLAVRWNCKAGKCGSCSAEINGRPRLMCMTRMSVLRPGRDDHRHPDARLPGHPGPGHRRVVQLHEGAGDPVVRPAGRTSRPGEYRMQQVDVERSQEFRKCIECFLCQNTCHVVRDHEENKNAFAGPRFLMRVAELDMHPLDAAAEKGLDRKATAQDEHGLGYCNITKCCTEVCPEHIKITDNALIPLKERVVGPQVRPAGLAGQQDPPAPEQLTHRPRPRRCPPSPSSTGSGALRRGRGSCSPRRAAPVRTTRSCRGGVRRLPQLSAEQADELQPAAALVGVAGPAAARLDQVGVPHLAHQGAVQQQTQPDVAPPCRSALVTSSLTSSSVVSTRSSRPQATQPVAGQLAGPARPSRAAAGASSRRPRPAGSPLDPGHQQRDVVLAVLRCRGWSGRGRRRPPAAAAAWSSASRSASRPSSSGCRGTRPGRRCRGRAGRRRAVRPRPPRTVRRRRPAGCPCGTSSISAGSPGSHDDRRQVPGVGDGDSGG